MDDIKPTTNEPQTTPDAANDLNPMPVAPSDNEAKSPTPIDTASNTPVNPPVEDVSDTKQPDDPAAVDSAAPVASNAIKPKRGPMTAVMIIVVLVVVALGVVGYYAFVKDDSKTTTKSTNSQTSNNSEAATANPETTSKEIDSAINNLDETKDYNSSDLSDTSLGL